MEALWTRFQPAILELKKVAEEGTLGDPVLVHADLYGDFDIESKHIYLYKPLNELIGTG